MNDWDDEEEFRRDDPDYDLSEDHGYMWDPKPRPWMSRTVLVVVTVLVVLALVLPSLLIFLRAN